MFRLHKNLLALSVMAVLATAGAAQAEVVLDVSGNLTYTMPQEGGKHFAVHPLFVQSGRTYTIDLRSMHFDTFLKVKNMAGMLVAQDDDNGPKNNSKLVFTATASGLYRIVATTYKAGATGAYKLRVDRSGVATPGPFPFPLPFPFPTPGTPSKVVLDVQGDFEFTEPLTAGKHVQSHKLFMKANNDYVISMNSKHFDTYVKVANAAGMVLAQNDDDGTGRNARLVFRPMVSGIYTILATSYRNEATGHFHLIVRD